LGDEIIAGCGLYGGTIDLFRDLEQFGIHTVYADEMDEKSLKELINDKTRVIFSELISNPALKVLDIPAVSKVAHEAGIPLFVDSTTATPYIARPIELGADVVIHSTSKYINGGGNAIGGIIVDGGKFNWDFDRYRALTPFKKYGKAAFSVRLRTDIWENLGGCMAPANAYLNFIGTDTLGLRMERICDNADRLAHALAQLEGIKVNYLTLPDHPCHDFVDSELNGYGGGILNFRTGSKERAFKIINSLKYAMIASNIGDLRTLVIHPASTLYIHTGRDEMEAAGVYDDTIRVSVGIEDAEDLIADFTQAVLQADSEET
jgi:O-acetylhomoserine (thiol)-lyase